ncbi:MAG: hypothetical protein ACSHX9_11240 [Luteolibacter sp.]
MKPDFNDPNNHVPPVSEDDDWDDLGNSAEISSRSLPPMRARSGVAEIKEGAITPIDEIEPEQGNESAVNETQEDGAILENAPKITQISIPSKRPLRKNSVKPMAAPKDSVSRNEKSETKVEKKNESVSKERIVLPSQDVKRFHVKEIGSGDTAAFARPDPTKMSPEELDRSKLAGGGRRWSKDAESSGWGSKVSTGNFKWIVFSGLGAMALVVAIVLLSLLSQEEDERRMNQSYFSKMEVNDDEASVEDEAAQFDRLNKSRDHAAEIYEMYAHADDLSGLKGLIHNEAKILPLIAENWEPLNYPESWSLDNSAQWTAIDYEGIKCGVLKGQTPDFDQFRAIFRIDGENLAIDWKATVGYSTSSYESLRVGEGDGSEIRGYLSKVEFHTFSYPESAWVSYRLLSTSGEDSIWVYAARESEIAKRFSEKFSASQITGEKTGVVEVTLTIEPGNDESLPNQWQINELLCMSWLEE